MFEIYWDPFLKYFTKQRFNLQNLKSECKATIADSAELKKILVHVAFSIGYETEFESVANGNDNIFRYLEKAAVIVYWASMLDIKYLSLYDPEGVDFIAI